MNICISTTQNWPLTFSQNSFRLKKKKKNLQFCSFFALHPQAPPTLPQPVPNFDTQPLSGILYPSYPCKCTYIYTDPYNIVFLKCPNKHLAFFSTFKMYSVGM